MSRPMPILPDSSRHEIRNTQSKIDFLLPHFMIRWAFMFILATAARRYNIGIVAYALMPTHIHIVVKPQEDPTKDFDLVEFRKFVRSNLAKFVNAHWDGRRGSIFCGDSVGDSIKILDCESELDQLLYTETNGVSAGLGKRPEDLKGAISLRKWVTEPQTIERPPFWFQERTWEAEETLQLSVPKHFEEMGVTREEFQEVSTNGLELRLRRIRKERKKQGLGYKSLQFLESLRPTLAYGHSSADHSRALMVGESKAAKCQEYHDARAWWSWHADALKRQKAGEENVVFPPGTYKAAKKYGAKVADAKYYKAPTRRRDRHRPVEERYERQLKNDEGRIEKLE